MFTLIACSALGALIFGGVLMLKPKHRPVPPHERVEVAANSKAYLGDLL